MEIELLSEPRAEIFDSKLVCRLWSLVRGCFSTDISELTRDSTLMPEPIPADEIVAMMHPLYCCVAVCWDYGLARKNLSIAVGLK